jgi:GNAT superfamily N-acetyltransferase
VRLKPFHLSQAAAVSSWATNRGEVFQWCGHRGARVPVEMIIGWSRTRDVQAYALHRGPEIIAYGELWFDPEENEVELARVIVAPADRGKGKGRILFKELADIARQTYPDVFMRIHPDNEFALRSSGAAGFRRVTPAKEDEWNTGQPTRYVWLSLPKPGQRRKNTAAKPTPKAETDS